MVQRAWICPDLVLPRRSGIVRTAARWSMFGYKVVRQYQQGIVLRWGKLRTKVRDGSAPSRVEESLAEITVP